MDWYKNAKGCQIASQMWILTWGRGCIFRILEITIKWSDIANFFLKKVEYDNTPPNVLSVDCIMNLCTSISYVGSWDCYSWSQFLSFMVKERCELSIPQLDFLTPMQYQIISAIYEILIKTTCKLYMQFKKLNI